MISSDKGIALVLSACCFRGAGVRIALIGKTGAIFGKRSFRGPPQGRLSLKHPTGATPLLTQQMKGRRDVAPPFLMSTIES